MNRSVTEPGGPPLVRRLALAALAGVGLTSVLLMSALPLLVGRLARSQAFLLAFSVVVVAYLCVAAGFALMGVLSARVFPLRALGVRPITGPYRFGVALGVSGGLLVIPTLLLSAVAVLARDGVFAARFARLDTLLFVLITGVYGLVSGTLLGLLLLRLSQAWRVALSGLLVGALGGLLTTLLLPLLPVPLLLRSRDGVVVLLAVVVFTVHLCWSAALRRTLGSVAARWSGRPGQLSAPARQVWLVATLGLLLLSSVSGLTRSVTEFVTSRPVDTSALALPRPDRLPGCTPPADPLLRRVWAAYTRGGRPDLSCGNEVQALLTMPGLDVAQPDRTTFDRVAQMVTQARREVLFTTMEYDGGNHSPGRSLTDALADLYARVKAHPEDYPDGLNVALTLGNYPVVSLFEWGAQVWTLLDDLNASGVPLSDPAARWQVRLGNYHGTYPHSHVKIVVIDGQRLVTAGFNYTFVHYPVGYTERGGVALFDLALVTDGPAAQDGLAAFDDLWQRSKQVNCVGGMQRAHCQLGPSTPLMHPQAVRDVQVRDVQARGNGQTRVFSLYRRRGETQANDALLALMQGTRTRLDLLHVNFSMNIPCMVAVLNPALCTERDQPPYLGAVLDAVRRGVTVRVLTDPTLQLGGIENRIAVGYLRARMKEQGLPAARLQVRLFPGRLHAKGTLTDDVLTVGSLNMHYSSWTQGPLGLNEAVVSTNDPGAVSEFRRVFKDAWQRAETLVLPQK